MEEYLTEENLGKALTSIYGCEWIHDKPFITRKRPDYRNDDLKLIVDFDGPQHYTSASRIVQDIERDKFYLENGYKTVRIPMFVQLSKSVIKNLFGVETSFEQTYPYGFIADVKSLVLPADFCELGILRFKQDLERFSYIKEDIVNSLRNKVAKLGDINYVLPPSLHSLLC